MDVKQGDKIFVVDVTLEKVIEDVVKKIEAPTMVGGHKSSWTYIYLKNLKKPIDSTTFKSNINPPLGVYLGYGLIFKYSNKEYYIFTDKIKAQKFLVKNIIRDNIAKLKFTAENLRNQYLKIIDQVGEKEKNIAKQTEILKQLKTSK